MKEQAIEKLFEGGLSCSDGSTHFLDESQKRYLIGGILSLFHTEVPSTANEGESGGIQVLVDGVWCKASEEFTALAREIEQSLYPGKPSTANRKVVASEIDYLAHEIVVPITGKATTDYEFAMLKKWHLELELFVDENGNCDPNRPDCPITIRDMGCPICRGELDVDFNSAQCHRCQKLWALSYLATVARNGQEG